MFFFAWFKASEDVNIEELYGEAGVSWSHHDDHGSGYDACDVHVFHHRATVDDWLIFLVGDDLIVISHDVFHRADLVGGESKLVDLDWGVHAKDDGHLGCLGQSLALIAGT